MIPCIPSSPPPLDNVDSSFNEDYDDFGEFTDASHSLYINEDFKSNDAVNNKDAFEELESCGGTTGVCDVTADSDVRGIHDSSCHQEGLILNTAQPEKPSDENAQMSKSLSPSSSQDLSQNDLQPMSTPDPTDSKFLHGHAYRDSGVYSMKSSDDERNSLEKFSDTSPCSGSAPADFKIIDDGTSHLVEEADVIESTESKSHDAKSLNCDNDRPRTIISTCISNESNLDYNSTMSRPIADRQRSDSGTKMEQTCSDDFASDISKLPLDECDERSLGGDITPTCLGRNSGKDDVPIESETKEVNPVDVQCTLDSGITEDGCNSNDESHCTNIATPTCAIETESEGCLSSDIGSVEECAKHSVPEEHVASQANSQAAHVDEEDDFGDFASIPTSVQNETENSSYIVEEDADFGDFATSFSSVADVGNEVFGTSSCSSKEKGNDEFAAFEESTSSHTMSKQLLHRDAGGILLEALDKGFPELSDLCEGDAITEHLSFLVDKNSLSLTNFGEKGAGIWQALKDVDNSHALGYQFVNSLADQRLLTVIGIDTRNILKASLPVFASGLATNVLEPVKSPKESCCADGDVCPTTPTQTSPITAIPPVQFDWGSSGLTNPLEGSLDPELAKFETPSLLPAALDITSPKMFTSNSEAEIRNTQEERYKVEVDGEAAEVLKGLQDLSFMHSCVLMFPAAMKTPNNKL